MYLESNFQRLRPLLQKVTHSKLITESDKQLLNNFRSSENYRNLPKNVVIAEATNRTGLFLLKQAADALHIFTKGDNRSALQVARESLKLRLDMDPFRGFFYCFAARIAELVNDEVTREAFEVRYKTYQDIYALENFFLGTTQILNPQVQELFGELLEEKEFNDERLESVNPIPFISETNKVNLSLPTSHLTYVGRGSDKQQKNHPKVMIFTKPKIARFIEFESKFIKIETNGDLLEVSFDLLPSREAVNLFESLQISNWTIRFIRTIKSEPWNFSNEEVEEMNFSFGSLSMLLKQPQSWLEQSMIEIIDWEKFWFSLLKVVLIPSGKINNHGRA